MLERQREGIAKAKSEGHYKGRPVSIDAAAIRKALAAGEKPAGVARRLGVPGVLGRPLGRRRTQPVGLVAGLLRGLGGVWGYLSLGSVDDLERAVYGALRFGHGGWFVQAEPALFKAV